MNQAERTEIQLQADLRDKFIGWQCLIRQYCARQFAGRPLPGMKPTLIIPGHEIGAEINVVLVKKDSRNLIEQFKHMVRSNADPNERYDNAIRMLSSAYYQKPLEFSGQLTALFSLDSKWADFLANTETCELRFSQANHTYRLRCQSRELDPNEDLFQVTFWHNHLFNSYLPGSVRVVVFTPDWELSIDESER